MGVIVPGECGFGPEAEIQTETLPKPEDSVLGCSACLGKPPGSAADALATRRRLARALLSGSIRPIFSPRRRTLTPGGLPLLPGVFYCACDARAHPADVTIYGLV
jgi:hypothetical protein